jgi:hypothetical protein
MTKTEIICFCQKINRIVKLLELSDTLTQKRRRRYGRCWQGEEGTRVVVVPLIFLSPYFPKYTNDEPLKTNFRFIDPPQKTPEKTQTKNKSHLMVFVCNDMIHFSMCY